MLSIIIPAFNVEKFVGATLRTLMRQKLQEFEVIVIDDCSQDNTLDTIQDVCGRDSRFRVFKNSENIGLGATRNRGLSIAENKYVAFLDSDDFVSSEYYYDLIGLIQAYGCPFIRTGHTEFNFFNKIKIQPPSPVVDRPVSSFVSGFVPPGKKTMIDYPFAWAGIFEKNFLIDTGIRYANLHTAEDRLTVIRMHNESDVTFCSSNTGIFYRRESRPTLRSIGDRRQLDIFPAIISCLEYVNQAEVHASCKVKVYTMCISLLHYHYENRSRLETDVRKQQVTELEKVKNYFQIDFLNYVLKNYVSPKRKKSIKKWPRWRDGVKHL